MTTCFSSVALLADDRRRGQIHKGGKAGQGELNDMKESLFGSARDLWDLRSAYVGDNCRKHAVHKKGKGGRRKAEEQRR